jgi:hypothetical protein
MRAETERPTDANRNTFATCCIRAKSRIFIEATIVISSFTLATCYLAGARGRVVG